MTFFAMRDADRHGPAGPAHPLGPTRRRILITGASGALGGALATRLAAPGHCLLLSGRNEERLKAVAGACRLAGAEVELHALDMANLPGAIAALVDADGAASIDAALLVAGQGDAVPPGMLVEPADQVERLAGINFTAPAALAAALASRMAARGHGRILLVSSAAAFHALPHAPAYAASKAGLVHFGQALRLAVRPSGVTVTVVSPGFIDWPTGGRPVPRLFLMSLDEAASRILLAFERGVGHAIIPRRFAALRLLDRMLPAMLREWLLYRLKP